MPQPNMQQMMKQVQKMQADMMKAQESLKEDKLEASAGGGMIKVVITGDLVLQSIEIDPDAVDPEDVEMLQDMVMAAINEALRQAMELQASSTGVGGMDPASALDALGGLGSLGGAPGGGGLPGGAPPNRAARRKQR